MVGVAQDLFLACDNTKIRIVEAFVELVDVIHFDTAQNLMQARKISFSPK